MSFLCGMECVMCLGCSRWAWKRCTYIGSYDSENWAAATADEFQDVPHICRLILAVYEEDLRNPRYPPTPGGYRLNPDWVVKRVSYDNTGGKAPPYLIYADRDANQVVLAIRGLNLGKESDYKLLLDNKLGMQMFDGGYVHHGLVKSAVWLLERESETIKGLVEEMGTDCKVVFAGHSLGSGVAALMTIVAVNHRDRVGGVPRSQITGYAVAPARCMSLNLAVKYADVIHSIVLQDDFLPRTPTPLENIFKSLFCLPCLLFFVCMRDTFIPEGRKLRDPRRLYAPGRMYHIVERKFCRCGRFPPEVRTAIPVEGRFEYIVLSSNATKDHGIIWIEKESEKALTRMKETMQPLSPPAEQKLERMESHKIEHKNALERAVSLNVPYSGTLENAPSEGSSDANEPKNQKQGRASEQVKSSGKTKWEDLVETLFERDEAGDLVFRNVDIEGQ